MQEMQEMPETWVQSLDWEDTLAGEVAIHSSILLACEIPKTEEPGGLQPRGHKESDMTVHTHII